MLDTVVVNLWVLAGVCALTWILSLVTKDTSWVDRIWSIVPAVYVWVFAAGASFTNPILNVMGVLVTLWAARLTFNFARKGGYARGGEDYRWEVLRNRMSPRQFHVFNLFFIVIYQNIILFLITLPAFTVLASGHATFGTIEVVLTVAFLAFLGLETVADQQQWSFYHTKYADVAAGREPRARFLTDGLFRFSRHPNFFAEQSQWWVIALFGAAAAGSLLQVTAIGAILLTVLLVGSARVTESISLSKYPEYADYQRRTSPIIPWFPRPLPAGNPRSDAVA
jgi:steroid 5-alpha reductase family enzyme